MMVAGIQLLVTINIGAIQLTVYACDLGFSASGRLYQTDDSSNSVSFYFPSSLAEIGKINLIDGKSYTLEGSFNADYYVSIYYSSDMRNLSPSDSISNYGSVRTLNTTAFTYQNGKLIGNAKTVDLNDSKFFILWSMVD